VIEDYIRDRLRQNGYDQVRSPQLYRKDMWERSGHWEHYRENMFEVGDEMILKPMNCPAHVEIFRSQNISYRDLPLRYAEFGCCHRNEPSGALNGIMRLRQFVQDDAHIFCREDQIEQEVADFCALLLEVYGDFGFTDVHVGISMRPDDRAGDDTLWDRSEAMLQRAVERAGISYEVQPGEGAFYGPKLEFGLSNAAGKRWQCGTLQLDFVLPGRLGARYAGPEGLETPVMIHRAILGSLERFIGILLEHYGEELPDWLCPVQAVVIPVRENHFAYAAEIARELGLRVHVDRRDINMMSRVKEYARHVPRIIVVGDKEVEERSMAVRSRGSKAVENMPLGRLIV
jgi:threonyl-tRNA synthetase